MKEPKSKSNLGFLTVVEYAQYGLFGGYLVLNTAGRPLEFHCTAPIRPNRAQEILYGPTLEPYLFGEQIGQTLLNKAKSKPLVVFTDREPAMAVREHVEVPVALVLPQEGVSSPKREESGESPPQEVATGTSWRLDAPHERPHLVTFHVGHNRLAVASLAAHERPLIEERLAGLAESFDFGEPFQRIREAIEEARRGGQ